MSRVLSRDGLCEALIRARDRSLPGAEGVTRASMMSAMKPSDHYVAIGSGFALACALACGGPSGDAVTPDPAPTPTPEKAEVAPEAAKPEAEAAPVLFEDEGGTFGYRDAAGEVVIPPTFAMASPFTDGVAAVVTDEGWVFIDRGGKTLATAFVFDNGADEFAEGRARITEEKVKGEPKTYGFLATSGEIVVAPTWSWVLPYSDGRAAVCQGCTREQVGEHFTMVGGSWGYVDLDGKLVVEPSFEEAAPFAKGRASVKRGGKSFEIGPDGKEL